MTLDSERATKSLKKRSLCYILFFYPSFSVVRNSSPNSLLFARMNTEKSWVEWKSQKKRKSFFKVKVAKSKKLFYNFVPSSKKRSSRNLCPPKSLKCCPIFAVTVLSQHYGYHKNIFQCLIFDRKILVLDLCRGSPISKSGKSDIKILLEFK